MNIRSVSGGIPWKLVLILAMLISFRLGIKRVNGSEITVTATGVLSRPSPDYCHVFNNRLREGEPFRLVFKFDGSKGKAIGVNKSCTGVASGVTGDGEQSPGTAELTIGGESFTFGKPKTRHAESWREIASICSQNRIIFFVSDNDNENFAFTQVRLEVRPGNPRMPFTRDADWRGEIATDSLPPDETLSAFSISGPGMSGDQGFLIVKTLTIEKGGI